MEVYTNSMLKDWQNCKNKFFYKYIKKIIIPPKEGAFELGKKVHALISYKLNGYDTKIITNNLNDEVLSHYESILKHPVIKYTPVCVEWGFNVHIGKTEDIFAGRIDAVFNDKENNKFIIADWKTGMKIPQNILIEPQAQIYLYAFFKAQEDLKIKFMPEDLSFKFIQTPSLNETSINFSQELLEQFEENFIKTVKDIKKYIFKSIFDENSKKCAFCEYKFLCNKKSG